MESAPPTTDPPRRTRTIGVHLVAFVAIQLVCVLGLIGFAALQDFRRAERDANAHVRSTAKLAADYVAADVGSTVSTVDSLPEYAEIVSMPNVCEVTKTDNSDPRLIRNDLILADYDGTPVCGSRKANIAQERWFQQAIRTGETVRTGVVRNPLSGDDSLIFAHAFPQEERVVAVTIVLKSITTALDKQFGSIGAFPQTFVVTTRDRSRELSSDGERSGRTLTSTPFARAIGSARTFEGLDGTDSVFAEAVVEDLGWHVFAGVPRSAVIAGETRALGERTVFAVFAVLLVIAAAIFLNRRFVRPIRSLGRATAAASRGDLDAKVAIMGPTELVELGESFNEMLAVRKQAEAALLKAYTAEAKAADDLREVGEMRNAFLMAISHELRTPLTSVVGYATFLNEEMDDLTLGQIRSSISAITSQSKRLERLMLDLLDVERMSRGIVEPHLVETDLTDLVMRVIESSSAPGRIRAEIKENVIADVDPALVERIMENLIVNAIKHTPPDSDIWVRAKRANGQVCLSVEDTGNGVPDNIKTAIFEPFVQGEVPEHSPGTGVGLTLVSQFSKLHGGRAWVEDRRGGGSVFRIELPAKGKLRKPAA